MRIIREMVETDKPFIYSTWLRSQYFGHPWFKQIEQDAFFDSYKRVVEARLSTSKVLVSCLADDPDVFVGYAVVSVDETTLHWVYVKKGWRRLGEAKLLIPTTITTVTSLSKIGKALLPQSWKFNPFL